MKGFSCLSQEAVFFVFVKCVCILSFFVSEASDYHRLHLVCELVVTDKGVYRQLHSEFPLVVGIVRRVYP